jgi:hypothetical protein
MAAQSDPGDRLNMRSFLMCWDGRILAQKDRILLSNTQMPAGHI